MVSPELLFISYTSWTGSGEINFLSKKQAAANSESRIHGAVAQFSYTVNSQEKIKTEERNT